MMNGRVASAPCEDRAGRAVEPPRQAGAVIHVKNLFHAESDIDQTPISQGDCLIRVPLPRARLKPTEKGRHGATRRTDRTAKRHDPARCADRIAGWCRPVIDRTGRGFPNHHVPHMESVSNRDCGGSVCRGPCATGHLWSPHQKLDGRARQLAEMADAYSGGDPPTSAPDLLCHPHLDRRRHHARGHMAIAQLSAVDHRDTCAGVVTNCFRHPPDQKPVFA